MRLVIVESPAKAKTINKYLGSGYKVMASYGHIRDLLSKDGSVQPDNNFAMTWQMSERGKKCIQDITKQLGSCEELLLATDPDREGEAISWHIKEVLSQKLTNVPVKRIAFHEITKNAIKEAIAHPRDIDSFLVDAYLARRALDYLVGFTLSPILWRKLPGSKSAGRVQSVALRIITDRETEIEAFQKREYWSIEAQFKAPDNKLFPAHLTHYNNKKLDKFDIQNEKDAQSIVENLVGKQFFVSNVESKTVKRNPAPAFITSTLQQEASRKLGFSAKKTMQLAQNLYEGVDIGGETIALITYMRTDSINLSKDAIDKIRSVILEKYGSEFIPAKPRIYTTKVKNAQEAHEAIRPVDAGIIPDSLKAKITPDLLKLYTLIWKRAVASQMSSAEFNQVQVDISDKDKNIFRANGNSLIFEGFLKVYVEGTDDIQEEENDLLPPLKTQDITPLEKIEPSQHFTTPPPRFSEASLVKKLEELGIGRPSTYATILQVLQDRGYVKLVKKFFIPEVRGRLVTTFLVNFFSKYLEYGFTADMEQSLDDVSNGGKSKDEVLGNFWKEFYSTVEKTKSIKISDVIDKLNQAMEKFLFTKESGEISRQCPECGKGELSLKIGRFGSFIGCSRYPECNYVKKLDSIQTENDEKVMLTSSEYPKFIGNDENNVEIYLKKGPYGLYLEKKGNSSEKKEKPKRASLPKFITTEQINTQIAEFLFNLPKTIGSYENNEIKIGIGKFGPYVLFKGKYVSIPKPENIFSITEEEAIDLLKQKKFI